MHQVIIDPSRCIGCGACVKDCVAMNLYVEEKKAHLRSDKCIYCGHCEAVCPVNAVTLTGFEDKTEAFDKPTLLDPETLLMAIRTRRSIRQFQETDIPRNVVRQIIEAGRLAPTGGNSQGTSYIIIRHQKKNLEAMAVSSFRKLANAAKPVIPFLKNTVIDDDFFFKKAPLVILVCSSSALDAGLAAQNMAFMAEANGLGVLYSGFFTMCANMIPKIKKALHLKKKTKVITTLVIGYPNVNYHRTVHREKADIKVL